MAKININTGKLGAVGNQSIGQLHILNYWIEELGRQYAQTRSESDRRIYEGIRNMMLEDKMKVEGALFNRAQAEGAF